MLIHNKMEWSKRLVAANAVPSKFDSQLDCNIQLCDASSQAVAAKKERKESMKQCIEQSNVNNIIQANEKETCRACLIASESFTHVMFKNVSADVYAFCTSIEINRHDDLPKTLCNTCYELLEKFSHFKNMCIQSQSTLAFQTNINLPTIDTKHTEVKCEQKESCDEVHNKLKLSHYEEPDNIQEFNQAFDDDNNDQQSLQFQNSFINDSCVDAQDDDDEPLQGPKKKMKVINRKVKLVSKNEKKKKPKVFEYICGLCKSKFKYKDRYEAHLLEHQGVTVNKTCSICQKVFQTWSGLKRHSDSEHEVVRLHTLRCKVCGKVFKSPQTLRLHGKQHAPPAPPAVCHLCGKRYATTLTLKLHLESHNEHRTRDHPCEHCGKKFYTKHILHSHTKRLHTGQRYICQVCDYPFTDKYNLQKHVLKIHQGIKEHKCDICDKYFSTHSTLVIHKRIHSGERPYVCTYCGKGFSSKNRQIIHHRTHTGERPHRCEVCNLAFSQLGTMKRHMKTHSKMAPTAGDSYQHEKAPDCVAMT